MYLNRIEFYLYVDGESHFRRSEEFWKKLNGDGALLETISSNVIPGFDFPHGAPRIRVNRKAQFFWDTFYISLVGSHCPECLIGRAVYFTSCVGDEGIQHDLKVAIRNHYFDPVIIPERKQLADQRANLRNKAGLIEKPKAVDIGLAVRVLEDAYFANFKGCVIFTSDVDFLPLVRAVRRMGKLVFVAGYREGLSERSPLEYEPDQFLDLGLFMERQYRHNPIAQPSEAEQ
jgi:uncharacterized LabA/DUF88 family protein